MSLRLALTRMRGANYQRLRKFIAEDAKASGKPRFWIFCDICYCSLRYGAAFHDYHTLRFYNRKRKDRKTFVTMGINVNVVKKCNNLSKRPVFEAKTLFNQTFEKFLKRKWADLHKLNAEQFTDWLGGQTEIFAKRDFSCAGRDVAKITVSDYPDANALYNDLLAQKYDLVEEAVVQHPYMAGIYPDSVNTLRLMTMLKNGEAHLIFAFLRAGMEGYVDNLNAGGCCTVIDAETGVITSDAMTKGMLFLEEHPVTGFHFKGSKFPLWDEAVALVKEAACVCPEVRFVAWDVALTERGPLFIEANYHPGYDILQLPDQIGKKEKLLRYI